MTPAQSALSALKELDLAEYEAADHSVGLQAGWSLGLSEDAMNTIRDALQTRCDAAGLVEAFIAGFKYSAEGFNGEYPFGGVSDEKIYEKIKQGCQWYIDHLPKDTAYNAQPKSHT